MVKNPYPVCIYIQRERERGIEPNSPLIKISSNFYTLFRSLDFDLSATSNDSTWEYSDKTPAADSEPSRPPKSRADLQGSGPAEAARCATRTLTQRGAS